MEALMTRKKIRDWDIITRNYWLKPIGNELPKEVNEEAFKMNRFWNELVAIGEKNRQAYQDVLAENKDVASLKEQYEKIDEQAKTAYDSLKKARIKYRTKTGPLLQQFIDEYQSLQNKRTEILQDLKKVKAEVKIQKKEKLDALFTAFRLEIDKAWKKAYSEDIYWANANAIKDDYLKAWQRGLKTGGFPKFHRFTGDARFCHQFIGGRKTIDLFIGRSKLFSIDPIDQSIYSDAALTQRQRKKKTRTFVTALIGGVPIKFHTNLHRDIPEGYAKQAIITKKKVGTHTEWGLSLTIEVKPKESAPVGNNSRHAAIDLGFRIIDDNMRIGVLITNDSTAKQIANSIPYTKFFNIPYAELYGIELWMPPKVLNDKAYAKKRQSVRDRLFEEMKRKSFNMLPSDLPAELKANWDKARQPRLIKIMKYLKENRHFLSSEIEKWYLKDRRLYNEISGLTARAIKHRKWFYYNLANILCKAFGVIVVEKHDWAKMAKVENTDGTTNKLPDAAREYRTIAGLGEMAQVLKYVAGKKQCIVSEDDPKYKTMECHLCHGICKPDDRSKLVWQCEHCSNKWDQDYNAGINLFRDSEKKVLQSI
jgi:transposase